ncbi:ATP-binding cassette domain-containing protein [Silvanigrella aquatica]|uniref:ABC transporter domain-containing protein n=1 Tax=Silvanigrella aquatica TaxID=1915309 RepID=A0A1L4D091_9BACT|nr:ATP-binding cassette domain-containing protein [Silvanigrella aquatica]APJ03597.1 hypothetical protein AXG55_06625 [Silvanigrella aquatica]
MSKKKIILSVRSLCKDYRRPSGNMFTVLEGIHLDIYDGEFLALVGLSGSGKSTLLRCMAGLINPDRGTVSYATPSPENMQLSAFVFQNFALFPWMSIRENIAVSMPKLTRQEQDIRIDRIIQMVGLKGFEDAFPRELSGGMRQRVSLARAMVSDPMIMFMDEPFSALDPLTSESLRAELVRLWAQPDRKIRSCVLVTHRFEEALQLADRILILSSNPGTIFRSIEINLPRPRMPNSPEYKEIEEQLEKAFGQLHLDKVTDENEFENTTTDVQSRQKQIDNLNKNRMVISTHDKVSEPENKLTKNNSPTSKQRRIKPLINTNLTLVEGLVSRLSTEVETTDLYDLCEDMGQSVDQVLPAVAAAETLGFIITPGIRVVLTDEGRLFASEHDAEVRGKMMRNAILKLPVVYSIYELVKNSGESGLEADIAIEQIVMMLPFEDHDVQFQTLLKWCRYANLIVYDSDEEKLFIPD